MLRAILWVTSLNALVLASVALSGGENGLAVVRIGVAGCAAVALNIALLVSAKQIAYEQTTRRRRWRRAPLFGALSAAILLAAPTGSETLFAATLTPVGVCVLLGDWRGATLCAVLIALGFAGSAAQPRGPGSLGAALSDVIPMLVVIAGGLVPANFADKLVKASPWDVARLRLTAAEHGTRLQWLAQQRHANTREHNRLLIEARLRAGEDVEHIAAETGLRLKTIANLDLILREKRAVAVLLTRGHTDAEIAAQLKLSLSQVRSRRGSLALDLGVDTRDDVLKALRAHAHEQLGGGAV